MIELRISLLVVLAPGVWLAGQATAQSGYGLQSPDKRIEESWSVVENRIDGW